MTWTLRTLKNAYEPRPPTRYIVDKFLATHTINVVYGAPGVMKSMVLADLCACVASGRDWLVNPTDMMGIMTTQVPVLWIDADNGRRRTDERFDAFGKAYQLPEDTPLYYVSMPDPAVDASDNESVGHVIDAINTVGAELVVFDNLGVMAGDVEENAAKMAFVMAGFRAIAEDTGVAVVVVHHQRKGGAGQGRAGDALRGHSSIEASLDLALQVVRDRDTGDITVTSTKTRGVDVPTVTAQFNYRHRPGTNDLEAAWFTGAEVVRGKVGIHGAIIDYLRTNGPTVKGHLVATIHELTGGGKGVHAIRSMVEQMVLNDDLQLTKGQNNAKIISI